MSFSEAEVETILEELRAGATACTGAGRCYTTYSFRDGEFRWEEFDEGYTHDGPTSEAEIRELIAREPRIFLPVLAEPHWRHVSAAILAGEHERAREHLRTILELADPPGHAKLLDAALAWPDAAPSAEVAESIRYKLDGLLADRVLMRAGLWDRGPTVALRGVELADRLIAMVGPVVGSSYLRAMLHEQAGDLAAAERDMLEELARPPASLWHQARFTEALERLRRLGRERP